MDNFWCGYRFTPQSPSYIQQLQVITSTLSCISPTRSLHFLLAHTLMPIPMYTLIHTCILTYIYFLLRTRFFYFALLFSIFYLLFKWFIESTFTPHNTVSSLFCFAIAGRTPSNWSHFYLSLFFPCDYILDVSTFLIRILNTEYWILNGNPLGE